MPLPTVTLTGTFLTGEGPATGEVALYLTSPMVDAADNVIVPVTKIVLPLNAAGKFSTMLVPSDAAGLAPTPVPYQVVERIAGGAPRLYQVVVPSGSGTVDLSDLAPVGPPPDPPSAYTLLGDFAAEVTARGQGDAALASAITTEAGTRATADTTNANAIAAEATSRASADATLTSALATEITNRTNADTTEAAARAAADALAVPLIGGAAVVGGLTVQDVSYPANVGPVLTAPGGQRMRVRLTAAGVIEADPIGTIQPAVFIPLLGSSVPVTGTGATLTIPRPAGTVTGAVLLAVIDNRGSQTITPPSGWTLIKQTTAGAFDSTPQLSTYYRVAGGSEPANYAWTFSASSIFSGSIAVFGNVDNVTPVAGVVDVKGSSAEPSLTLTGVPAYGEVLFAAAVDTAGTGTGSVTAPAGSTAVWDAAQGPYAHSHLSMMGAGPAGGSVKMTATHTPTGANFAAQLIALTPATVVSTAIPQLKWAPPSTAGYTPLTINTGAGAQQTFNLAPDTDYVISAPAVISGGVVLSGGRNVVWVGGEINIPTQADQGTSDNTNRRALLVTGQTGIVHLEGLLLDGVDINEGIDVASPLATVQLQNIRAVNMHTHDEVHFSDNHVDLIQTWGGCKELRVDKCTFQSDYQGVTIKDDFNSSRHVTRLSRINGKSYNGLGQYFYWFDPTPGKRGDVYLEDVWAPSDALYTDIGKQVWPDKDNPLTSYPQRAAVGTDGISPYASWPTSLSPSIVGAVRQGQPVGGDFAPAGTPGVGIAGAGYLSPGYQYAAYVAPVIYLPSAGGPQTPPAVTYYTPADPTGTASTSLVHAGLALAFTPSSTGKLKIMLVGNAGTATSPVNVTISGRYGTGTAPANGAAVSGTQWGKNSVARPANSTSSGGNTPFQMLGVVTGLTVGTAYWFDVAFDTANAADTAFLANMTAVIEEIS